MGKGHTGDMKNTLTTDSLQYLYETNKASALHWRVLANGAAKAGIRELADTYRDLSRQQAEFAREILEHKGVSK